MTWEVFCRRCGIGFDAETFMELHVEAMHPEDAGPTPEYRRFENLLAALVRVPKVEIDEQRRMYELMRRGGAQ